VRSPTKKTIETMTLRPIRWYESSGAMQVPPVLSCTCRFRICSQFTHAFAPAPQASRKSHTSDTHGKHELQGCSERQNNEGKKGAGPAQSMKSAWFRSAPPTMYSAVCAKKRKVVVVPPLPCDTTKRKVT
jgi:hypothetical protein